MPTWNFCNIINCNPFTIATASCSSSSFIVKGIASYVKDITFGRNVGRSNDFSRVVDGNKKQIIKADGQLEAFCGSCNKDEDLKLDLEIFACGKLMNYYALKQDDIGALPTPRLGGGWSDDKQMAAFPNCFEGTVKSHGGSKSITALKSAGSFEEIQKSLSAGAKGKASAKFFSAGVESNYARHIKDTRFTKSFYFMQNIELPTAVFQLDGYGVNGLSKYGKSVYDAGPEEFRKICGNRLITEVHQGAALYVTLKIHFASHYDKKTFEAHSKASFGGIAETKTSIKTTSQTYKVNGNLELLAYQAGGDASKLAKVFGQCNKQYCVTACSLDNLDTCDGIIGGVLSYAQNDFPEQIDFQNGVVFGSASPIAYTMPKLSDVIGLAITNSVVTDLTTASREYFGALLANQTEILDFVKHALDFPEAHHIPGEIALQNLNMANSALKNNIALIESAALACYSEPSECEMLEQTITGKLTNVTLIID